jgi:hypothetical protein
MDVVKALLPCRIATTIFLPIFDLEKKYFLLQNNNKSNNIYARFNVLHKTFIGVCQLLLCWILAYGRHLEADPVVSSRAPTILSFEFARKTGLSAR